MFFLAGLHLDEQGVKALEIAFPDPAIPLDPSLKLLQGGWAQGIDSALRVDANVDQPGLTEHAEMLGHLRLAKAKLLDHVPDRAWTVQQQFDDLQTVWLGQGSESF
jgi:hypothetical protein